MLGESWTHYHKFRTEHFEDNLKHQLKMIEDHKNGMLKTPVIILVVYGHLLISPQFWRARHAAIGGHPELHLLHTDSSVWQERVSSPSHTELYAILRGIAREVGRVTQPSCARRMGMPP